MLVATNFYRSQQQVANLTWNDTSATVAQKWSDACNFKHSVCVLSFLRSSYGCHWDGIVALSAVVPSLG